MWTQRSLDWGTSRNGKSATASPGHTPYHLEPVLQDVDLIFPMLASWAVFLLAIPSVLMCAYSPRRMEDA